MISRAFRRLFSFQGPGFLLGASSNWQKRLLIKQMPCQGEVRGSCRLSVGREGNGVGCRFTVCEQRLTTKRDHPADRQVAQQPADR